MSVLDDFERTKKEYIATLGSDVTAKNLTRAWFEHVSRSRYSYHFTWMGIPIIQFPQDIIALQELIWSVKPDIIIETGVAHGGSLVFSASMLQLLGGDGIVVGIDIDIREHNREVMSRHPMFGRIRLIEGSSIDPAVIEQVRQLSVGRHRVLVILDSNHEASHVLSEIRQYEKFVTKGSYLLVYDTIIDEMPESFSAGRQWRPGHGPKVAVAKFLQETNRFVLDQSYPDKLLITVAPGGYLRCVQD